MQASKSIEKKEMVAVTSPNKSDAAEELISQIDHQELKIFGEKYRIESANIDDNSLTFSTTSSASYYVLQILDKKSTSILSKIKHENVTKVVVSGDNNDVEIPYVNFDMKSGQTFFVREFVAGEIASQYFKMQIIRPEGRTKKLTRVRVKSLFSLMYVIIDVLISSNQSIIVRLNDVVISTTSNSKETNSSPIKIINIRKGTKKDNTLVILLDEAIDVFQKLLMSEDHRRGVLNTEDIDEIKNAEDAAKRMKEIVLTNKSSLEDIKNEFEKLYDLLRNEAKKELKNKQEELNTSISTRTDEIIKILNPQKKSTSVSEEQKAKIATIIGSVSAASIATKNIKRAFVQTFDMAIDSLANNHELSLSWPFSKDDLWHATILVRRPKDVNDLPCDDAIGCLTPVLMRTYKNNLKYASSDWISNDVNLVAINSSCAGIPIKWYSKNGRANIRNAVNGTLVIRFSDGTYASSDDDNENKMIRFVVVKELSKILHPYPPESKDINPFVRNTYISAKEVGWEMVTEIGIESSINTEKLQYLISIPFYTPFTNTIESAGKNIGEKIIAVAHFEIEQLFGEGMIEKIAEKLAYFIQDKNCFGLNDFHSVILKDVDIRDC
jgi:hypothetical protein